MLKGSLRKNGFDRWRLVCNGVSAKTGEERTFFFEFYIVNPLLSPDECILGFKSRLAAKTEADLQYALAGTQSAATATEEILVHPSYVMVKAGCLARGGKQLNAFFPSSKMETGKKDLLIRVAKGEESECILTDSRTRGAVSVKYADLMEKPELLCNAGSIDWDLQYERMLESFPDFSHKNVNWSTLCPYATFMGKIHFDGEEFNVLPKSSFGYIDKNWGHDFTSPFFHLNASSLTSTITGKALENSCFVVQGEYDGRLSVFAAIEDKLLLFSAQSRKKYSVTYECIETPRDEEGVKLHWMVSVHDRNTVMDIDIFCNTESMFVRDYESPAGGRKVMKVLGGGTGSGEIRLYRRVKKNLELIEHATVTKAVCEYGNFEYPEK
jgi:hypothetical protein